MLLEYFTNGTQETRTGHRIGLEIETDFVLADDSPITAAITSAILSARAGRPQGCEQKLELGRQKIELAIAPQSGIDKLLELAHASLQWLYRVAEQHGAHPFFGPEIQSRERLLLVAEERDQIWVELDGRPALGELFRCSSVQFTVDIHPGDVAAVLNALWVARLHERDYAPNDRRWQAYIKESRADYRVDRYGGPEGFDSLADYARRLARHDVVMHHGRPVRLQSERVGDLDIDLFLRSVWWHYRLRRFGDTLAVEMRPFARRTDDEIARVWDNISATLNL